MNERAPPTHIADRVKEVLRFDRFYAQRLRDASKAAKAHEVNAAELGILLELLPWPCPPGWLSWRLGLTELGRRVARSLEKFQENAARKTLTELPVSQRLVEAMNVIIKVFEQDPLTNFLARTREDT